MNLEEFDVKFKGLKQSDKIKIECEHPDHCNGARERELGREPARRNIQKHGGERFICRDCTMSFENPMTKVGTGRNALGVINVKCTGCDKVREMDSSCYYGPLVEPYVQICGSCAQKGKEISVEQREKTSATLKGRELTTEHRENISKGVKNSPIAIAAAKKNLIPGMGGIARAGQPLPEEWKANISAGTKGKEKSPEHKTNISLGRKKMLEETGGFTPEHRENISKSVIRRYQEGFNPKVHHISGWHISEKAGKAFHRSSYESKAFRILDADDSVKSYEVEKLSIRYDNPAKGVESGYIVDITGVKISGAKFAIEVKPEKMKDSPVNRAKQKALLKWAKKNDAEVSVWTMKDLFKNEDEAKEYALELRKKLGQEDYEEIRAEANREKAIRYYNKNIKDNKVVVKCECGNCDGKKDYEILQVVYDNNIKRNGKYICKECSDRKPKPKPERKKINPLQADGKKQCEGECEEVRPLDMFSVKDKMVN